MIRIWSTLSAKKEDLPGRRPLRFFVCGPTVYNYIHIGNARTYMNFDLIVRHLRSRGVKVFYLQNITDIDDKIIRRAAEENVSWRDISKKFQAAYLGHMKALDITSVDKYAPATKFIPDIERQVLSLMDKGFAYTIPEDGIYFDISKFPDYGKLARRTVEQAEDGVSRIDASEKKKNRGDFCLWKFSKPGDPVWKSKLGEGRPGWHIEDTAITGHFFGEQYEVHGGGADLIFPHHEAEIAQAESASGKKPFVQIWMHAGFLVTQGAKMSKSQGNFLTMNEALERFSPETFRMMTMMHHYRAPMEWNEDIQKQAEANLENMRLFLARLDFLAEKGAGQGEVDPLPYLARIGEAMDDDFNTPQALAALFELMNEANQDFWNLSPASARRIRTGVEMALENWGFRLYIPRIPWSVRRLAKKRNELRGNKQFIQADALRVELEQLGYRSDDTPLGPFVWPSA